MSGAFVQVAPDSTGKKVQTFENTIGVDLVEAQGVVAVDASGVPISPLTDAQLRATAVPVSLASNTPDVTDRAGRLLGHVTLDNASIPVTGTFWQATQPISGSISISNFPASQAVTGTFWQATQPVSGTVTANAGTGSFTIAAPTLTKGTQGATGLSVQSLKDAGRTPVILNASGIATVASEALVTIQKYVAGTVTTGVTEYVVTAGKTLRVQQIIISFRPTTPSTTVTFVSCTWKLRRGTATLATSSSLVGTATMLAATNVPSSAIQMDIPDGLEFAAADHIGFTQIGSATTGTFDITLIGFEY